MFSHFKCFCRQQIAMLPARYGFSRAVIGRTIPFKFNDAVSNSDYTVSNDRMIGDEN
jgi:hypothetical protein